MVRQCGSAHCSGADQEINEICKQLGWPVNHPVLTRDSQGPCTCSCSCLAHGTLIQIDADEFKAIEEFSVGDMVLASGLGLTWQLTQVNFSQGTTGASRQKFTILVVYDSGKKFLAVTSDHIFLMADGVLKAADRLTTKDLLVDPGGKAVAITSVHIGDYTSGFHHIATSKAPPNEKFDGHLLNTNGVVSADYTVQLYYRAGTLGTKLAKDHSGLPVVGSPEYTSLYGDASLKAPASLPGGTSSAKNNAREQSIGTFVSANLTLLKIPADAHGFISDTEAAAKAKDPHRPWNDPLSREWTEYLLEYHHFFYPDVQYHLDWANNTVNAYAWIQNGVRHVALLGGLVRHMALELEGIGLVLAHELAHHYGGPPTFPGGLSCEGQSDYAGVAIIMRRVWFGEDYISKTVPAIKQMANFFGVPNNPTAPGGSAGCNHPPGACRVATYHRAVNLQSKPGCAG